MKQTEDIELQFGPEEKVPVRSMRPVKFKDKPNRGGLKINLVGTFGFVPEEIVIQKVHGENNKLVISAIVPESEKKKNATNKPTKK